MRRPWQLVVDKADSLLALNAAVVACLWCVPARPLLKCTPTPRCVLDPGDSALVSHSAACVERARGPA